MVSSYNIYYSLDLAVLMFSDEEIGLSISLPETIYLWTSHMQQSICNSTPSALFPGQEKQPNREHLGHWHPNRRIPKSLKFDSDVNFL